MFSFAKNDIIISVLGDLTEGRLSNLKRISCYVFALLLFMQSFFVYAPTKAAVTPPPPSDGCYQVSVSGNIKIQCTKSGTTINFTHAGDYRAAAAGYIAGLPVLQKDYQFWATESISGEVYYLMITVEPIISTKGLKIQKVARKVSSCSGVADNKNCYILYNLTNGITTGSGGIYTIDTDTIGWGAIQPDPPITPTPPELNVLKWVADTAKGSTTVTVVDYSRTAPTHMAECGKNTQLTEPISTFPDGVKKYVADIQTSWMTNLNALPAGDDKDRAIAVVTQVLADPNDLYSATTDIDLFKQFYDGTYVTGDHYPPKYPTVAIDNTVYTHYYDLENPLSTLASASTFNVLDYWVGFGSVLKAGGVSMYDVAHLPLWSFALGSGAGMITGGVAKGLAASNVNDAKAIVRLQLKIYFAHLYMKNNLLFNKCLLATGDPFAFGTAAEIDAMIQKIDSILSSSFHDLDGFGTADEGKTVCDGLKGNYIVVMLKQAFCGLLLITKQWADTAYNASMQLLATSIGVATDVTSVPTTDSADTINVGPNKTSDSTTTPGGPGGGENPPTGGATTGDTTRVYHATATSCSPEPCFDQSWNYHGSIVISAIGKATALCRQQRENPTITWAQWNAGMCLAPSTFKIANCKNSRSCTVNVTSKENDNHTGTPPTLNPQDYCGQGGLWISMTSDCSTWFRTDYPGIRAWTTQ